MSTDPGSGSSPSARIAVIVPCYKVTGQVLDVLAVIGPEVERIYCVDDACPDGSGDLIEERCNDPRVTVLRLEQNLGVGGAVLSGYRAAIADGAQVLVKLDGDGQLDPALIPLFAQPILEGHADYTKGNRFFNPEDVRAMPGMRIVGNAALSFMSKLSSGCWHVFDPNNGFTALHASVAARLPFDKISQRYFFESDMLFRLNSLRALIVDIPMTARYGGEQSNLSLPGAVPDFFRRHVVNTFKRVGYDYFLRDFNIGSLELVVGLAALIFGISVGSVAWIHSIRSGVPTSAGTVMLAALPVLAGIQLLLGFINYDMANLPRRVLHRRLSEA